jgi:ADP-heptose:LPS heptosyltransferase
MLQIAGIAFYSLQKGDRSQELAQLPPNIRVQDLAPCLHDFGDTALLLNQFDLVLTVDTAVAHLAGALGKPVWVLLPAVPSAVRLPAMVLDLTRPP